MSVFLKKRIEIVTSCISNSRDIKKEMKDNCSNIFLIFYLVFLNHSQT